jgi:hypothetical protein
MKKKLALVFFSFFLAFILYAIFVTKVYHKEISVKASLSNVSLQVSSTNNIARWYIPFATSDTANIKFTGNDQVSLNNSTLRIINVTSLSATYNITENNQSQDVVFDLIVDSITSTKVTLSYETTLWNKFLGNNIIVSDAEKSLQNLKDYFENTKKIYGYELEINDVTDTAFLFISKVVAITSKRESFKNLFESLIQYAKEKNSGYNGTRIFYSIPYGKDSIHLFTSIGITNTANIDSTGPIALKRMPGKGLLLTAFYQGKFGEVNKVLNALEQYKTDNGLIVMAIPFIKLITEGIDFDDDQIIQAKACYPIFLTNKKKDSTSQ